MIRKPSQLTVSINDDRTIHFRAGRKAYDFGLDEALAYAYWLIKARQYEAATKLCEAVARFESHARRAAILMARCEVGVKNYTASCDILKGAFAGQDAPVAEELQAAFVYHTLGMHHDAIRSLAAVAQKRPDLPTVFLLLGDWFARLGDGDRAVLCWRSAVQRDRRGGSAARAAREELSRFKHQTS